ncbi:MAG: PD40 domain-containing protein, partial [Anaerolineales bacterium]|nr:PD40 domain-containing protein [Anaerolineales bacterium]
RVVAVQPSATPSPTPQPTETLEPTATATPTETPTVTATLPPTATPRGGGAGQIAFVSERAGGVPQIFLLTLGQSYCDMKPLTVLADGAGQPAGSPDGRESLFITPCTGKKATDSNTELWIMNADGTNVRPFINQVGGVFEPDWSASGIAYTFLTNGRMQLWRAGPDGKDKAQLSKGTSADSHASWSPDGARLVFLNTTRGGRPTLYWMNQDGNFASNDGTARSQPEQVTRDVDAAQPDWSPDGQSVAFVVNDRIYVVEWNRRGFDAQNLTGSAGPNEGPDWSPDGRWITFESWRQGNHDIWIMTANGGQPVAVTTDPAWDYQPAWRP